MSLSFRTETFRDTYDEITDKINSGELKEEDIDSFVKKKGINVEDFSSAESDFLDALDAGEEDLRARTTVAGRTVGRAIGEVGEGVTAFADVFLPETVTNFVGDAAEAAGEYVPDSVKKLASEVFDPYHGEGLLAGGEEIVGTIGAYVMPGQAFIKGANLATKGTKALSPSFRALMTKTGRNVGKGGRKLSKAAGTGTAYAAGATVIENPEENVVNVLTEAFPESTQFMDRLAVNPNDSEAEQYVQAFLNNMGLGSVFAPIAIASAYKKPILETSAKVFKPIGDIAGGLPSLPKLQGAPARFAAALTSRRGTDDTLLGLMVENSNAAKAALVRSEGLAQDLKEAVKKAYGKKATDEKVIQQIDRALQGEANPTMLKKPVQDIIIQMRKNIDELSSEASRGAKGELKAKMSKNLGTYVTRSYDIYDDPVYAKQMSNAWKKFKQTGEDPKGVFAGALKSLNEVGIKGDEAINAIGKLMNKQNSTDVFDSLLGYSGGVTSAKSGLKKSDKLPQGIRDMLGEVKNPYANYVKTFSNLSEITAQQRYLRDVADHLKTKGLASKTETGQKDQLLSNVADSKLGKIFGGGATKQMDNPLEGLYVTDVYKDAIENGLELTNPAGKYSKMFMRAKGLTQTAQTVYSPVTHGRNVMGNMVLTLANGMIPVKGFKEAAKTIAPKGLTTRLLNKSNKELAEQYARYVELGIANSGLQVNFIRRNLAAFDSAPEKWLEKTALSPLKKTTKGVTDLYQAEDDFFKIAHFEKTLDYIKKSKKYRELPLKEQERIAAQRTRDLMPNYNLVPKFVKQLRGAPVGDFISFPAEMARVSKNLAKYTLQDLSSGDAALFAEGAKRAAGLTAAGVMGDSIADMSRYMAGITDEQEDAINNLVPSWEHNQDRIYLTGIEEDERGHAGIDYVNLGPIDPFSYLKQIGKGMHELIATGDVDEEKSDAELTRIALGTFETAVGPFASPSMLTEAMFDLIDGKRIQKEGGPTLTGQAKAAISPIVKVITPKFMDLAFKRAEYEKSLEKYGDYAIKPNSLATWPEGEVDLPATFGIKKQRMDLTAGTRYAINPVISAIDGASSKLNKYIKSNPNLNVDDVDNLTKLYEETQLGRASEYERLKAILENYQTLYGDRYNEFMDKGLSVDGGKEISSTTENHMSNALQSYFEPYEMPKTDMQKVLQSPIPYELFDEIYRDYEGAYIP